MYTNNRARFCTLLSKREKQPTSRPNFPPFYLGLAQEGPALPLGNAAYNQIPICFSPLSPNERSDERFSKTKNIAELSI